VIPIFESVIEAVEHFARFGWPPAAPPLPGGH
jgi:hypothetical protein